MENKENITSSKHPDDLIEVRASSGQDYAQRNEFVAASTATALQNLTSDERQQLLEERDEALEQVRRLEVSRDELARQQGQFKGRIAKAQCAELLAERKQLQQCVGLTPERCKIERTTLLAKAKKAVKMAYESHTRMKDLEQIAEHEAQQRLELNDFASLENKAAAEAERAAIAQIASLESQVAEQAAALKELQREATAAQISVRDKEAEIERLSKAHASCTAAAGKAEQELRALHETCKRLTQDRTQAITNIRVAENEVDLIHQANEQMFRYLNYVRLRLSTHLEDLQHLPDLLHLLKDLHAWCARESRGRSVPTTPLRSAGPAKSSGTTPAPKGFASRTPLPARSRIQVGL